MPSLVQLRNPGPKSSQWLHAIGVYTLEGLSDIHWTKLPASINQQLKAALQTQ